MTIKKAILIGLLSASIIGLVAYGIKHKSFSKENLTKTYTRSAIRVNADNGITDLSNTTITFNSELDVTSFHYYINFKSNNTNYTEIKCFPDLRNTGLQYDNTTVATGLGEMNGGPNITTWENEAYKTIYITGGTDATNSDLIIWLKQNATQETIPPTPPTPVTQEVIDIRGLMLQILTMPFTFISQAFDVTLWPNTQYEFNIGNFIMSIIAIASILFIIKLFTSGFSIIGNYTGSRVDTKVKKSQIEYNKAKTDLARRTDPNTKTRINKKEK